MKKIILIVPIIFLLLLAIGVKAQISMTDCPDKCENSILYTKGILDSKLKICIYGYQENCKYGCRINDTKIFETPSCNILPKNDTSTALEKIYSDILKIQNQTSNTDANYKQLYDEITKLKAQVYQNSPSITVHGTEYAIGEMGKVWVQVLDSNKTVVNNATCLVDIYAPCGSHLIEDEPMFFLGDGIYYYDFIVPNAVGVYPSIVECFYISTIVTTIASSGVVVTGTTTSGDYTSTWVLDEVYWIVREASLGGKQRIQTLMNFSNVSQPALQSNLNIVWIGIWNSAPNTDSISIYIMNFTSGNWILLPNAITDTGGSIMTVANSIATTNATSAGFVKNGIVSIMFNDTNGTDSSATIFKSDYVHVDIVAQFSPQYQSIIGSGEIHVSSQLNLPYTKETLCGVVNGEITEGKESSCSIFTHTGEFPYAEGEIEDNITITALETKVDQLWSYTTPYSVSCDAIYWLKYYNGTDWINVDLSSAVYFTNPDESCKISVPVDFTRGQTYSYRIKMDNYIKWEIDWSYSLISTIKTEIMPYCDSLISASNYTYIVPILNSTIVSQNPFILSCHHLLDDVYYSEHFYNLSLETTISGTDLAYLSELRFYRTSTVEKALLLGENGIKDLTNATLFAISGISLNISGINDGVRFIGGTEYSTGESGLTSVQFLKGGNPVNTGVCNLTIYYPNGTMFINDQAMTYLSGSNGIYSRTFTVPNTIGVYREQFLCSDGGFNYQASGSFHNSDWANNITNIYQLLQYMNSTESLQFNSLYNLMISVNNSIIQQINAINSTINANIFSVNGSIYNYITAVNQSINSKLDTINNNIISTNTSLTNLINGINTTINSNINAVNQNLNAINNTIMTLLYQMNSSQGNFTSLENLIASVNGSINNNIDNTRTNLTSLINAVNSTINSNIFATNATINSNIFAINQSIANQLYSLTGQLQSIQDNITLVYNLVGASNATIMNKLFGIQNEITSVNDTVKSINQSIQIHLDNIDIMLNSMQSDLTQIKGNLTEILALSQEINVTVNGIVGILGNISTDISGLNSSLIAHIDTSLSNLEFNLTTLIISVNNTVLSTNMSIMNKLFLMQDEIASLNQTIINGLLNISNVTVNITASQKEVINTMFALYGNQAKNRNYAYLGIGGGLTGFLTGGDSGAIYYCKDNMTLATYGVQNQIWNGTIQMNNSAITEDLQHCTYGCVQNACVIPQYMIWAYILFALIIIFGIYLWIEKVGWMSSEE